MEFVESHLIENGRLFRSYKNKRGTTEGFLEDYAFLIQAYITLYQTTFHEPYLHQAKLWTEYVQHHFFDPHDGYFHFTSSLSERLIARKKEIFDNVIPASNSVMAANLLHLGVLLDHREWSEQARRMTQQLEAIIRSEPVYLSHWGMVLSELIHGLAEVVMVGETVPQLRAEWDQQFHPFALLLGTQTASNLPLLQDRTRVANRDTIFVCYQQTCQLPVHTVTEARAQLRAGA
jgi:uncharacterized protein YyaL (SSP411 family)